MELLVFQLEDSRYALPLGEVQEVVRAVEVTPLPGAPEVVRGVIDVRGVITPVFDLRARLDMPVKDVEPSDQFVLASAAGRSVALHVDAVEWMATVSDDEIASATTAQASPHIAGIARLPDGLALIHDLATFWSADESTALNGAMRSAR